MNLFKQLEAGLYLLSSLFFYPVILVLIYLLGRTIFSVGVFCKELWLRLKNPGYFTKTFSAQISSLGHADKSLEIELHAVLEQAEQKSFQDIQSARYNVKMGPTLGLIGTLTPMAKALSGLAEGNLNSLSTQMITAFSTTVIGLIIGAIAYSVMHVRLKWQRTDLFVLSKQAEEKLIIHADKSNLQEFPATP